MINSIDSPKNIYIDPHQVIVVEKILKLSSIPVT
jgi:hypothetical protein